MVPDTHALDGGIGLENIWKCSWFPKLDGRPSVLDYETIRQFCSTEFHAAIDYFHTLKLAPNNEQGVHRVVFLDKTRSPWVLYLCETRPEQKKAGEKSTRDAR
jgi:hypothetical protein